VWDLDKNNEDDMIGECEVVLGKIWGAKNNILEIPLKFKG